MRRFAGLAGLVLLGALYLSWPTDAVAHATLVRAEPAENAFLERAPAEIILTFSETLDAQRSRITVLDAQGQQLATGGTLVDNGLRLQLAVGIPGPGIYNVLWENVSTVDGHELRGSYPFTVLNPDGSLPDVENLVETIGSQADPPPQADAVAVRALSLLGLVIATAAALPLLLTLSGTPNRRRWPEVALGAGTLILAIALALQLLLMDQAGGGRSLGSMLSDTRLGQWWIVRTAAVAVLAATPLLWRSPRAFGGAVLGAVCLFLAGYTATSHAAAGSGAGWAMISDFIHGATAVAWIGAVVGLAVTARVAGTDARYRTLMRRFGRLASVLVFALLATGFTNSLILVGSFDDLWTTRYGVTLLVKLGLAVPLLAVAFFNSRRGARWLESNRPESVRRFLYSATAEVLLAGAVIFLGGMLTQSTVAKNVVERPEDKPFNETSQAADLAILLQIDPNRTGLNSYRVTLSDATGPVEADRVRLTFRYQDDQTIGASTLGLARAGDGLYAGAGPYLTLEGDWRVEVEVRRPDVDDVTAFFDVRPAGAAVGDSEIGGTWSNPAASLSWNEFGGVVALLFGAGVVLFKGWLPRKPKSLGWASNGATVGLFGVGMLLLFGVHGHSPVAGLPRNPVFPDADSVERGRTIYQMNCAACHGMSGVPPPGLDLDPYPLDLTVHVPQHPDGQIFLFISDGLPGTAMRPWGSGPGALSDEEIWHVVNYLRTLGQTDR